MDADLAQVHYRVSCHAVYSIAIADEEKPMIAHDYLVTLGLSKGGKVYKNTIQ
jgi:heme oxygenase